MRRVYTIYILKSVLRPLIIELAVVAAFIGVAALYVSLPNVVANALTLHGLKALSTFFIQAFIHTDIGIQALSLSILILIVFFVGDSLRRISRVRAYSI